MSRRYLSQALHEYPSLRVEDASEGAQHVLQECLEQHDGILTLPHRYAGRTFCKPGKRLRLRKSDYWPDYMGGTGLDELWMLCTTPIVTGVIDQRTGEKPFREGESHVVTASDTLVSLQELILAAPELVIGPKVADFSRRTFGYPTWPIVSKKFDNENPIPHHLHWMKWEVYDINEWDNPGINPSHYYTTAMGLYPGVTRDDLLRCMRSFGKGDYNGVRYLSPHTLMRLGYGFTMPNGVLHAPTGLCTHELHVLMDEHFLAEDRTLDGRISADVAFLACREQDYPAAYRGDWEHLVNKLDFAANQDPNFVRDHMLPPIPAPSFSGDGATGTWIVYGDFLGEQKCSILRLTLEPGASIKLPLETPAMFFINSGKGKVGKLQVKLHQSMQLGKLYPEIGFITQAAVDAGVVVSNKTGDKPLVLTLDFPQFAHSVTPGLSA
ncbi:MAG: hypothetical protein KDD69_06475 [Bdellovibrionales bacterium]|nr:hypothetical protein [Bdellovibrionales bacterium]